MKYFLSKLFSFLTYKKEELLNPDVLIDIYYPKKVYPTENNIIVKIDIMNTSKTVIKNQEIKISFPDYLNERNYNINNKSIVLTESLGISERIHRVLLFSFNHFKYIENFANFNVTLLSYSDPTKLYLANSCDFKIKLDWRDPRSIQEKLKMYIKYECFPIENPFNQEISEELKNEEELIDIFFEVLTKPIEEESFKDLYNQILKGISTHISSKADGTALIFIAGRFETFLKLVLNFSKEKWKLGFNEVIRVIYNLNPNEFKIVDRDYWVDKSPMKSNLRVAIRERHRTVHEAYELSPTEIKRGINSVFISCIYCVHLWSEKLVE